MSAKRENPTIYVEGNISRFALIADEAQKAPPCNPCATLLRVATWLAFSWQDETTRLI